MVESPEGLPPRQDIDGSRIRYQTRGTPWTMIINKRGIVRYIAFHIAPDKAAKRIEELKAESDDTSSGDA